MSHPIHPRIRPARPEDLDSLVELAQRFVAFGPPPWRSAEGILRSVEGQLARLSQAVPEGHALLVAELPEGGPPLGFISLEVRQDPFTGAPHGHVSDVVVGAGAEGLGVGRALMHAGEDWARERGYTQLTLNVFALNARARSFYLRLGYGEELLKMVKVLEP